jgi:hypothetical protein
VTIRQDLRRHREQRFLNERIANVPVPEETFARDPVRDQDPGRAHLLVVFRQKDDA